MWKKLYTQANHWPVSLIGELFAKLVKIPIFRYLLADAKTLRARDHVRVRGNR